LNKKGLSLIEIVLVIIILGIAMLPLLITYANVITRGMKRETISIATGLATELMEEIESKRYDENESSPWTEKQNLGVETGDGEIRTDKDTFDDVDDFITTGSRSWIPPDPPFDGFPGYSVHVEIHYVKPENLDDINPEPPVGPTEYTDFKKIIVTISHSQAGNVRLVSVKQGY